MSRFLLAASSLAIGLACAAQAQDATDTTQSLNDALLQYLPFDDESDFENAMRGQIATLDADQITAPDGTVIYDIAQFDFLQGDAPATANPSLWRQSRLNAVHGLFEVVEGGIYQVRGFDLAVMSFIRGDTGWIIVDPLTANETAAAGLQLLRDNVEDLPVTGVIFTHSHVDHFGGVKGITTPEEIEANGIPIVAPEGFFEEAVSENLIAGNTMSRRASYMYGNVVAKGPDGSLGSGLGTTTAAGEVTIVEPTLTIEETPQTETVDGIEMVFLNTPGAEAPAELMFYIPKFKAMMQAEEINHTLHNLYTLRGAKVRSGDLFAKYINDTINRFGDEVEVSFGSHHWPTWGNDEILDLWKGQRDTYRYIHDETLRLANTGETMLEIAEQLELPDSLAQTFSNRGYYGSVSHNAKAQYQLYFGWFSGNPSELHELPPAEEGAKFVEYAGGAAAVIEKAQADYDAGEYRWVATALNHVVFAEPDNAEAKNLLADALTQMGYQAESGPWRNFYLSGAKELRDGIVEAATPATASPDIVRNLPLGTYLDYLAVRLNHPKAAGQEIALNFVMPDVGDEFEVTVTNGVMNYTLDSQADEADATVTLDRTVLDSINLGQTTMMDAITDGSATVDGDTQKVEDFVGLLDTFEFWFNIVTP
ncbi:MBL fold metallo-hydrolase [Salipiger thiooxidans]|jgi:alkyl sulfatase BDS1-like metallo-beta-lactamase superfamily hydrolase|uniref:alkyl/aryl-sulfatase n=1 Tax=Salipiger thiooxidans TaxID=282683 RepID=UPI001A8E016A|nr:alkyl sulfatase dimerization domain-containing protein [Salipiger thiooxidans]MBN8189202.1 MBL fold metallo-hydrolase [Salipiger thiooxidans]